MKAPFKPRYPFAMSFLATMSVAIIVPSAALAADATPSNAAPRQPVTFSKDVAPIL